jgi:hypothetical protein
VISAAACFNLIVVCGNWEVCFHFERLNGRTVDSQWHSPILDFGVSKYKAKHEHQRSKPQIRVGQEKFSRENISVVFRDEFEEKL